VSGGVGIDIKTAQDKDLFDCTDDKLNDWTDMFLAEHAKGALNNMENGNGALWLDCKNGNILKRTGQSRVCMYAI
jgi:hypothetical protein